MSTTTTDPVLLTSAPITPAIGFNNDPTKKKFYVARAKTHQLADEIVKGRYWQDGKGCAVGCLIHGSSHLELAVELGIPLPMAYLIDRLFERLPVEAAKKFPLRFVQAICVGSDTNQVWDKFILAMLSDKTMGVVNFASERNKPDVQEVIDLCLRQTAKDYPARADWRAAHYKLNWSYAAAYVYVCVCAAAAADADAAADAYADARKAKRENHIEWQANLLISLLKSAR